MSYVYRLYNSSAQAHLLTASAAERDWILTTLQGFAYEGIAFTASGGAPVHRFLNTIDGSHFLTASSAEKDYIQANLPHLRYEAVAFGASLAPVATDDLPVYRFYEPNLHRHHFTASAAERDWIQASLPSWRFEGTAYYVQAAPTPTWTDGDDTIVSAYSAPGYGDSLRGGLGNDTITGGAGNDVLFGDAGDDTLNGLDGVDELYGGVGNDRLHGAGTDLMAGGAGDDSYAPQSSTVRIVEDAGAGTDTVYLSGWAVDSFAMPVNTEILVIDYHNIRPAGPGLVPAQSFQGTGGDDRIVGASASRYQQGSGNALIHGGAGNDTIAGAAMGTVYGDAGDDYLTAGILTVGQPAGGAYIAATTAVLDGGDGNDTLAAQSGSMRMIGGAGADSFLFDLTTPRIYIGVADRNTLGGTVTIHDFTPGTDTLSFRGTSLTAARILDRFQDHASPEAAAAVRGVFTGDDFGPLASGTSFEVILLGLSKPHLPVSSILASA